MNAPNLVRIALLGLLAAVLLPTLAGAQSEIQTLCGGSGTTNGIIAPSPILGAGTQGSSSVIGLALIIVLIVLLATGLIYVIAQVLGLPSLTNFVKIELSEMFGTLVIITLFFGAFYASAFAAAGSTAGVTNPALHFNGPGRSVFVNDCAMLGGSSFEVIGPIIMTGVVNYVINTADSLTFQITPGGFGFTDSPLSGWGIIPYTLNSLQTIMSGILIAILAIIFLLGLIYSLFPLFLYLGIVLRAFPWSRAAGGVFIALFIGFYIVFPIMLNDTMGGLSAAFSQSTASYYNSSSATGIGNVVSSNDANLQISQTPGTTGGLMSFFGALAGGITAFPVASGSLTSGYGVINGYIAYFMAPAVLLVAVIALSLVVALDFADILSDILGAPSLTASSLLGKIL
jgi:hypothetical protein